MEAIIYDTSLIFAIIAINMTVIGLTSLADMKSVVGIEYANFLLRKYKILGFIRIYHLLILFGVINVMALFLMLVPNYYFRLIYFWCLIVSLVFAIYYFFAYIIIESNKVKKQVYEQEILGYYFNSNEKTAYQPDIFTKVIEGSRTTKKMSGNFIEYFNTYTADSNEAFSDLFGPKSLIYDYSKRLIKKRSQNFQISSPYIYRYSILGTVEISHEFFQMYRYSNIQDKWLLTILDIFDDVNAQSKFDYIRLTNFTRVVGQINTFGTSANLYKNKFLEHLFIYYKKAFYWRMSNIWPSDTKNELTALVSYAHEEFIKYMFDTYQNHADSFYLLTVKRILTENILQKETFLLSPKEQLIQIARHVTISQNDALQNMFSEILQEYIYFQSINENLPKITIAEIHEVISQVNIGETVNSSSLKNLLFN